MNATRTLAIAMATGLSLTACASTGGDKPTRTLPYEPEPTTVVVENNNWHDMRVFAVTGGIRHRLGTVTSMNTRRYRVPQHLTAHGRGLRILVAPIGGPGSFMSQRVQVYQGQEVNLSVQNHLAISSIAVFPRR